jgi:hypothetical protein
LGNYILEYLQIKENNTMRTLVLAAVLAALSSFSFADSYFDFSSQGTIDATTATFWDGGQSITLWGFGGGSPVDLWYKNDGGDEVGVGLVNDPDHEIAGASFVQFTAAGLTSIQTNSVQPGEEWALYGSNKLGVRGVEVAHGGGDVTVTLPGGYTYMALVGAKDNVLLGGATAVPEGASLPMMGMGLVTVLLLKRRH